MMKSELTGRHVLAICLGAFGVIIAVNLFMAWNAIGSFPGVETKSSYIASQHFDRERAAQRELGWQADLRIEGGQAVLRLTDAHGAAVSPAALDLKLRRPTHQRDDIAAVLSPEAPGRYRADLSLAPGNWNADIRAETTEGTVFRQRLYLNIRKAGG